MNVTLRLHLVQIKSTVKTLKDPTLVTVCYYTSILYISTCFSADKNKIS